MGIWDSVFAVAGIRREADVEHLAIWENIAFPAKMRAAVYAIWRFCKWLETSNVVIIVV